MSCVNKCSKLTDFMQSKTALLHTKKVAAAELKLCAFVAEHLPISILDHLPGLISNVCEDSTISKSIKCVRTKGTEVFQAVFGKHYLDELIITLKKCKFSLIIDETTDISTVKQLVLIYRYYDSTLRNTVDKYLALISVTD